MADLDQEGQSTRIVRGGRGGMGNITVGRKIFNSLFRLKTSTHPGKVKKEKRRSLN